MADGTELILGWRGRTEIDRVATVLDFSVDWSIPDLVINLNLEAVQDDLKRVYRPALEAIPELKGCKFGKLQGRHARQDLVGVKTPLGVRGMRPWSLELHFDPHEYCEEEDDAVLGVSLVTRYNPTFLDWRSKHGGSGDVLSFDFTTQRDIAIARKYLSSVVPEFASADLHVKMIHY